MFRVRDGQVEVRSFLFDAHDGRHHEAGGREASARDSRGRADGHRARGQQQRGNRHLRVLHRQLLQINDVRLHLVITFNDTTKRKTYECSRTSTFS